MGLYLIVLMVVGLLLTTYISGGSGCVSGLPAYHSYTTSQITGDQVQAIVPSYRFSCPGIVTGWGGCFSPADSDDRYYVLYQVWREVSPGCYQQVGPSSSSEPQKTNLLRLEGGCNRTVLPVEDQVAVEEGDVVGFYVDYWRAVTRFTLFNVNQTGGFQVVSERTDVEFYYHSASVGGLRSTYALGTSSTHLCFATLTEFSWSRLHLTSTGAPVITVMFEPAAVTQTHDPVPSMETSVSDQDQQPIPTTIVFSGHPPSITSSTPLPPAPSPLSEDMADTADGASSTITQQTTGSCTVSTSSLPTFSTIDASADVSISPPHSTPTSSNLHSPPSSSHSQELTPIDATHTLVPSPVLSFEDGNSFLPDIISDRYTTMAVAASLLILLNILLITGAALIILCLRRRYKKQKGERKGHAISEPRIEVEPVRSRQSRASGGSQSMNRYSADTISMVSNLLYGSSPAQDLPNVDDIYSGVVGISEGGLQGKGNSRLAPDSMVYNGLYADKNGKMFVVPRTTTSASPRNVYSTTDSDGYEYIGHQ